MTDKESAAYLIRLQRQQDKKKGIEEELPDKDVVLYYPETNMVVKVLKRCVTQSSAIKIIKDWKDEDYNAMIVEHDAYDIGRIIK